MTQGFVPIRRGIREHGVKGRLSLFTLGLYVAIQLDADHRTGVFWGCAKKLSATWPSYSSERKIQKGLRELDAGGYLKRFRAKGKRGNYPMLINKYVVTDGELKGKVLNAEKSTSWQTPVYEASTTAGTDPGTNPGTDLKLIRGPYTRSEKVEGRPENRETKIKEEEKTVSVSFFEGQILKLTVREHEAFTRAHPKADLEAEYRKMDAWLVANPNRPKKSFARFANNWLLNSRNLTPKKKTPTDDLEFPYRLG